MNKLQKFIPALLVSATLGACGGGGGNTAPSAPAGVITETNLEDTAFTGYSSGILLYSMVTIGSTMGVNASAARQVFNLKAEIRSLLADAHNLDFTPSSVTGVVTSKTAPCNASGNVTLTADDADNSQTASAGDKVTMVFNNCATSSPSGAVLTRNGSTSITFTRVVGDALNPSAYSESGATINFQNLAVTLPASGGSQATSFTMNGSLSDLVIHNPASTTAETMTVPSFTLSAGGDSLIYANYELSDTTVVATKAFTRSVKGTITDSSFGALTLSTLVPFQGNESLYYPSVGKLKMTANASSAYITAMSITQVLLELDKGNDGTIDFSKIIHWGAISA